MKRMLKVKRAHKILTHVLSVIYQNYFFMLFPIMS